MNQSIAKSGKPTFKRRLGMRQYPAVVGESQGLRPSVDIEDFRRGLVHALRASFDAASTTDENARHWRHTDSLSARASLSPLIRRVVRERSRHEADNNSWYSGILRTATNHIVGTGPRLQVMSDNADANARLEKAWERWCRRTDFVAKLRVAFMTYWRDGQSFILRRNRMSATSVGLELCLYEAEQVSSPFLAGSDPKIEDGIRIDKLGIPTDYYILDHHPGDVNSGWIGSDSGKWYSADEVAHLFRRERPGQLHGIPRITPSLELFPKMRRHTLATLAAAEAVANWTLFVKTTASTITPAAMPRDFVTLDFARSMLNFLPDGWEPFQLKAEQPTTNHEMFQRQTLMEICRCMNFPYLLAAGTAKDSNFASANMDLRNLWVPEVESEQLCLELCLVERAWQWFLEDAVYVPGLLDGLPANDEIDHQWFWSPPPISNEGDAASAASERLSTGQSTHEMEYSSRGLDFQSSIARGAASLGVSPEEYKRAIFRATFPDAVPQQQLPATNVVSPTDSALPESELEVANA